jgi:ribose transport system substrate-binding protein
VVGWHSAAVPGPIAKYGLFTNITTDPMEVAKAAGSYAVADSDGKAGAIIFTDSAYAIAIAKSNEMAAVIKACKTCAVLSVEDTPLADAANRMPQLTTSLLQRYGAKWTYALSVNDLTFDFMAPSLQSAGIAGSAPPHAISAGDGSEPAFQRIRSGEYQVATVAEPLHLHGWQEVDELNRAFAERRQACMSRRHICLLSRISTRTAGQRTSLIPIMGIGKPTKRSGASNPANRTRPSQWMGGEGSRMCR